MKRLVALLGALLLAGCHCTSGGGDGARSGPIDPKLEEIERHEMARTYDGYWHAAMRLAEVASEDSRSRGDRVDFANRGIDNAEKAIALHPNGVEGHYYKAITLARRLESETAKSFWRLQELQDEAARAAELDPKFEHAGGFRLSGALYYQVPGGLFGTKDPDLAEENFQKAVATAPDWPENYVEFGKFYESERNTAAALEQYRAGLAAIERSDLDPEDRIDTRREIEELVKKLEGP